MSFQEIVKYYSRSELIILMGTFPPPLGGVSIHLKRLANLLESEGFNIVRWDISRGRFLFYLDFINLFFKALIQKNVLLHLHALNNKYLISTIFFKLFTRTNIYITNHNISFFETNTPFRKKIFFYLAKKANKIFVINKHILQHYRKYSLGELPIFTISPFLPPEVKEEKEIITTYPEELLNFLNNKKPLLLANASQLNFYRNTDLYGLDLCVELTAKLKSNFNSIGFIFAIANEQHNKNYLEEIISRIKRLGISENFYFLTGNREIWPLFKKIDLFLRPTNTDGLGISIAEALYFNKPVIASDVCPRPIGTVIFQNRNLKDLYRKTLNILNEKLEA